MKLEGFLYTCLALAAALCAYAAYAAWPSDAGPYVAIVLATLALWALYRNLDAEHRAARDADTVVRLARTELALREIRDLRTRMDQISDLVRADLTQIREIQDHVLSQSLTGIDKINRQIAGLRQAVILNTNVLHPAFDEIGTEHAAIDEIGTAEDELIQRINALEDRSARWGDRIHILRLDVDKLLIDLDQVSTAMANHMREHLDTLDEARHAQPRPVYIVRGRGGVVHGIYASRDDAQAARDKEGRGRVVEDMVR